MEDIFINYKQVVQKLPLLQAMLHSFGYISVIILISLIVNSMAGLTIVTIPVLILFLALQKYYVAGVASTGAKN